MIAIGTWTLATVDSDMATGDTEEHYYHDGLSSLPRGRSLGRAPWPLSSTTLEMEKQVDEYLSSKSLAEQVALSKFMAAVEYELPAARSRTTTIDAPHLREAGWSAGVAVEWLQRLGV